MMKRSKTLNIQTLMEDLNRTSRLLKHNILTEDYGMGEQGQEGDMPQQNGYDDYEGMEDEQPMGNPQEEEGVDPSGEQSLNVINQIRELAIQGIAQYANDVESEQYRALKRIWLETDKFYETVNGDKDDKK